MRHTARWSVLSGLMLAGLMLGWLLWRPATQEMAITVPCADITAGCALTEAGLHIAFDRPPRPLQPFVIRVRLAGVQEVHARFSMRGMEMGLNRYRLLPQGNGDWRAEVTLPACVQGRSDWVMWLEVDGGRYAVPFQAG